MFKSPKQLAMSDREYEYAVAITHLLKSRDRLGITDETILQGPKENPKEFNNKTIIAYALEVFKIWASLYTQEHKEFIKTTEHELDIERPIRAAIKAGGYIPIAYPIRLDKLFKTMIPSVKTQDKRFWIPLLKHIPQLRRSNYA